MWWVIWRDDPLQIVHQYKTWAAQEPQPRAVILYDTMWEATRKMADARGKTLETASDSKALDRSAADTLDVVRQASRRKTEHARARRKEL